MEIKEIFEIAQTLTNDQSNLGIILSIFMFIK